MGINVMLISRKEIIEEKSLSFNASYSRSFASSVSCYYGGENNSELPQICDLFKIDIKSWLQFAELDPTPAIVGLETLLYEAKIEENNKKILRLEQQIKDYTLNWELTYKTTLKGWISIKELKVVLEKLISCIESNPNFYENISFYFADKTYFKNQDGFLNDLILKRQHLQYLEKEGCEHVTYAYC